MLLAVGLGEGQETSIHLLIRLCQKLRNMAAVISNSCKPWNNIFTASKKTTRDITDSESCFFGLEGLGLGNNINLLGTKY